jgi:integrase
MYRVIAGYVAKLPGAVKEVARLYSTHSLRATTATLLLDAGVDIRKVQELLTVTSPPPRFTTNAGARGAGRAGPGRLWAAVRVDRRVAGDRSSVRFHPGLFAPTVHARLSQ